MKKKLYVQDADIENTIKQRQNITKNANAKSADLSIIKNLLGGLKANDRRII